MVCSNGLRCCTPLSSNMVVSVIIIFMSDNLEKIKKLPLILKVRKINLKEVSNAMVPEVLKKARKINAKVFAYRIVYKSQGHKVVGYIVEPRKGRKLPSVIWNRGGSVNFGAIKLEQLHGIHVKTGHK